MPELKTIDQSLPYRLRPQLLSATETALYRALKQMVEDQYVICPKVALNDVFMIVRPNENVHYFNKIFRKHVDFLLCKPANMAPVFGVEMVRTVSRSEIRAADRFMEELFRDAGLPLVRVPSAQHYAIADLVALFQQALTRVRNAPPGSHASDSVPMCPVCGKMMVLRVHRDGPKKGQEYYGCMDNPKCPGVIQLR